MVNPNKLAGGGEAIIRAGVPPYGSLETLALTRAALAAEERQQVSTAAMRSSWAGEEFGRQLANVIAEFANTPYKWVNIQTKPQHPIWTESRCVEVRVNNKQLYHRYLTAVKPMMVKLNGFMVKHLNDDGKMPSGTLLEDLLKKVLAELWVSTQGNKIPVDISVDQDEVW